MVHGAWCMVHGASLMQDAISPYARCKMQDAKMLHLKEGLSFLHGASPHLYTIGVHATVEFSFTPALHPFGVTNPSVYCNISPYERSGMGPVPYFLIED